MDRSSQAVVAASALLVGIVVLRFVAQSRDGTLDWQRERHLVIITPLVILSLMAVNAAGPVAQSVAPPLVILCCGLGLRHYGRQGQLPAGAPNLTRLGYMGILGAILMFLGIVMRLVMAQLAPI